jgi:RimJ/RimL family protein N-acetyltransferase
LKVDFSQNPEYLAWACEKLRVRFNPKDVTWLAAVDSNGILAGVVVYSRHSTTNCEMSVVAANPRFLTRRTLRAFFGYPFNQLGYLRVMAVTEHTNRHAADFLQRLGFVLEGYLRKWFGTADGLLMGMLKEECPWL